MTDQNSTNKKQEYTSDINSSDREYYAHLVPFLQTTAEETTEALQDEAGVKKTPLSNGKEVESGPRLLKDVIVNIESKSGIIAETDESGNVKIQATFTEKDKKNRVRRGRFYTGAYVEAVTMDSAETSADLCTRRGEEPQELVVKSEIMTMTRETGANAQRKGDDVFRKITNENFDYKPPFIQEPLFQSVRLDSELELDPNLLGKLVSHCKSFLRSKGGRGIEDVQVQLARFTEHSVIARANGTMIDQLIPRTSLVVLVKTTKGSSSFGAIRGSCGTLEQCLRRYLKDGEPDDLFAVADRLCQDVLDEANDLDRAEGAGILGSRCPVIFSPVVAGVFAHECYGHPAEGDIVQENFKDQSAQLKLKQRLGAQISDNPNFNLIDTPLATLEVAGAIIHRFNWGSFLVDHYGEPAKVCRIVEGGIMVEAMTDMHCHEYIVSGMKPDIVERMNKRGLSGSSRHENYSVPPIIRMRNTFILPDPNGPSTKEEMAAKYQEFKVKKGIYLASCKGGWVDTRNGTFNISGNLGYLIENGMITTKPVKDVNVTGKLSDLLSAIGGLGSVASMLRTFTGFCGKDNQWVPVDGGGPLVFLKEAQVGGGSYRPWTQIIEDYSRQMAEARQGKRSPHQVAIPEIESLRNPQEGQPRVCISTQILPFSVMRDVITSATRNYSTHELIWDPEQKKHRLVERRDRHAL